MPGLTDTQLVILSAAAAREDGVVLPLPDSLTLRGSARLTCLEALLRRGLIEEVEGSPPWHPPKDGEPAKTLRMTQAGLAALGIEDGPTDAADPPCQEPTLKKKVRTPPPPRSNATSRRPASKPEVMLRLLRRKQGASMAALQEATGWQPHSVRAALTGLRHKGWQVTRARSGRGETFYRAVKD